MHETKDTLTPQVRRIYFFGQGQAEGDPARKDVLGGKGAGLAALSGAGFTVPPGFTLSIDCCRYYHEHNGNWPDGLEQELQRCMNQLKAATGKRFGDIDKPLVVSVRSGAAVSMPGMMDTILNCGLNVDGVNEDDEQKWRIYGQFVRQFAHTVAGIEIKGGAADNVSEKTLAMRGIEIYEKQCGRPFPRQPWEALRQCINAVFESWNNQRAIVYRKAHGLTHLVGTAVNVQAMYDCQVSGIAFTANPARPEEDEILIESSYGLGESVVSGDVVPDLFVLNAKTCEIKQKTLGSKESVMLAMGSDLQSAADSRAFSLNDEQVGQLAALALAVEKHFGHPVDIEWGYADGQFALLQSRAIRGLDVARDVEAGRQEEIARLKKIASNGEKVWLIHNLSETLEKPMPLSWDVIKRFMKGDGGFGQMYRDFGYKPGKRVCEEGFLELICGRIYVDVDRAAELFGDGMPVRYDHQQVLEDPRLLESAPMKFDASKADHTFLLRLPMTLWGMFRCARIMKQARKAAADRFDREVLPGFLDYVKPQKSRDLSSLTASELLAELDDRIEGVLTRFGGESLKPGFFGGCARAELETLLVQLLGPTEGVGLCQQLTSGLDHDSTVEQNEMLYRVALGEENLDAFTERYGHRTAGEMELAHPRWREDQSFLEQLLSRQSTAGEHSPAHLHAINARRRTEAMARLPQILTDAGGSFLEEKVVGLATEAQKLLPYRESGKHYLLMGYELIRAVIVALSSRWGIGDDVFFLTLDELKKYDDDPRAMGDLIAMRKVRWQSAQRLDLPDAIDSRSLEGLGLARKLDAADELDGLALSPGIVTGRVCILHDPADAAALSEDCILVCPSTDPSWTGLFTMIRGLVVERGGMLSHGAIAARDFSIPAVACADATRRIEDGAMIRIDGDQGHISVIESET